MWLRSRCKHVSHAAAINPAHRRLIADPVERAGHAVAGAVAAAGQFFRPARRAPPDGGWLRLRRWRCGLYGRLWMDVSEAGDKGERYGLALHPVRGFADRTAQGKSPMLMVRLLLLVLSDSNPLRPPAWRVFMRPCSRARKRRPGCVWKAARIATGAPWCGFTRQRATALAHRRRAQPKNPGRTLSGHRHARNFRNAHFIALLSTSTVSTHCRTRAAIRPGASRRSSPSSGKRKRGKRRAGRR